MENAMGQKYNKVIQRINDIKDAFDKVTEEFDGTPSSVTAHKKAAECACTLSIIIEAIDGDIVDDSPEEVARGILASSALIDIIGSLAER